MLYTKQQLIDAYCASEGVVEEDLSGIIITTQTILDARRDQAQVLLDAMVTDAKDYMKTIALKYLARQEADRSVIDNNTVSM